MIRKKLFSFSLLFFILSLVFLKDNVLAQDLTLYDVIYDASKKSINIKASKEIKAEVFNIDNPPRTVIDLPGAVYPQISKKIDVNNEVIKQIRISQYQTNPSIARISIETLKETDFEIRNTIEKDVQSIKLSVLESEKRIVLNNDSLVKYSTKREKEKAIKEEKENIDNKTTTVNNTFSKDPANNFISFDMSERDNMAKISINAKDNIVYKYFMLDNPDRLVVDTYGTNLNSFSEITTKLPKLIQKLRFGTIEKTESSPEGIRLVFELKRKIIVNDNKKNDTLLQFTLTPDKNAPETTQLANKTNNNYTYVPKKINGKYLVVIDPGHGGNDPGAVGPSGTKEKDVTLGVGYFVRKMLMENGISVLMARGDDSEIELQPRVDVANNNSADLFVSVHCNALDGNSPTGVETYYRTPQSLEFAKIMHKNMIEILGTPDRGVRGDRNLFVTRKTTMPSVLIEIGYITNPKEETLLASPAHQKKVATAIYKGIREYLGKSVQAKM